MFDALHIDFVTISFLDSLPYNRERESLIRTLAYVNTQNPFRPAGIFGCSDVDDGRMPKKKKKERGRKKKKKEGTVYILQQDWYIKASQYALAIVE